MPVAVTTLAKRLRKRNARLVLAESCTGGLVAAALTEIPGISEYFCGSLVVYREPSKRGWLGVKAATLKKHSSVSAEVASEMARGALRKTPEATLSGAITGYLGPSGERVGLVYISVLRRGARAPVTTRIEIGHVSGTGAHARKRRRAIAARSFLRALEQALSPS